MGLPPFLFTLKTYNMEMSIGQILFFSAIGLLIGLVLLRLALSIDGRISLQRASIALLVKLCEQQGVPKESIDQIKKEYKVK
jgi:hypothetical protein